MKKILTVSIAAYNVEKYIEECLIPFYNEKIVDALEIFIIDDGGTDNTMKIAKKYADEYPDTFKLIHKKNGGWGSTVNYGIEHATVAAELVVVCFQAFALRNDIGQYFKGISYIKILIAVVTSTVVCIWFTQVKWSNFSVLMSSGCTFFAIYGVVLLVLREKLTIEVVKGIFEKKNRK